MTDLAAYVQQTRLRRSFAFLSPVVSSTWTKLWVLVCSELNIAGFFFALQTFHLNSLVIINV